MCCGTEPRADLHGAIRSPEPQGTRSVIPPAALRRGIQFEYLGTKGMTVVGPITGNTYVFPTNGSRVNVDVRDELSLIAVPQLRQIRTS